MAKLYSYIANVKIHSSIFNNKIPNRRKLTAFGAFTPVLLFFSGRARNNAHTCGNVGLCGLEWLSLLEDR